MRGTSWVALAVRLVLGGAWLGSGLSRITDPLVSVQAVQAYDLLPASLAEAVGYSVPAIEVVIGLALLLGAASRGAAAISSVLLVALLVGTVSAWARGLEVDLDTLSYPLAVARDLALLAASVVVLRLGPGRFALDQLLLRRTTAPEPARAPEPTRHPEGVD